MNLGSENVIQYGILTAIVLLAIVLNLGLMPLGHSYDLFLFQSWGNKALQEGLPSLYQDMTEIKCSPTTTNHPPLHLYILKFDAWLNYRIFQDNKPLRDHYLVISKLISCLANIMIGLLIYFFIRSRRGIYPALAVASIYLFNPALIYVISYWGQADAIGTLFMLLSLMFLLKNRPLGSTICLSLGVLIQLRTIIILPILILIIIQNYNFKKIIFIVLINLLLISVICLPYLMAHQANNLLKVATDSSGMYPYVSCKAANLWYLISPHTSFDNVLKDTVRVFGMNLRTVGLLLFGAYSALILYHLHKNKDIMLAAAAICFAFFMLPTEIHSRYLFPGFAFIACLISEDRRYSLIYIILSVTYLLNLMMVLPFQSGPYFIFGFIQSALNDLVDRYSYSNVTFAIAIINLIAFIGFSTVAIRWHSKFRKNDIIKTQEEA